MFTLAYHTMEQNMLCNKRLTYKKNLLVFQVPSLLTVGCEHMADSSHIIKNLKFIHS